MWIRVLVTGHQGSIGSVLAPMLHNRGHDVVGLDTGFSPAVISGHDRARGPPQPGPARRDGDDLEGSKVLHLAALSNDPL